MARKSTRLRTRSVEVNVHQAKTHLSRLLGRVEAGEEVVIARAGKPVARLIPYGKPRVARTLGLDAGLVKIAPDFDAPLPEEVLSDFET
jgi:prevent-host-death family protein